MENQEKISGNVKLESPFLKKLENFWYHYKWHTIIILFTIVVILILSIQMLTKTKYDGYILYAGHHEIKRTSSDGDTPPYNAIMSKLESICGDTNGDGKTNLSFLNLFVVNKEEEDLFDTTPGEQLNTTLIQEDTEKLQQTLIYGEYYLCFLSERIFRDYEALYGGKIFTDIRSYAEGVECEFASDKGIYLRSLDFYSIPEISALPDDTVVCLRAISEVSGKMNRQDNEKAFARGEEMLIALINFNKK